jgi:hypothetical protein
MESLQAPALTNKAVDLEDTEISGLLDENNPFGCLQECRSLENDISDAGERPSSSTRSSTAIYTPVCTYTETDVVTPYRHDQAGVGIRFPMGSPVEAAFQQWVPTMPLGASTHYSIQPSSTSDSSMMPFFVSQQPYDPAPIVSPTSSPQFQIQYLDNWTLEPSAQQHIRIDPQVTTAHGIDLPVSFDSIDANVLYTRCAPVPFCGLCPACSVKGQQY